MTRKPKVHDELTIHDPAVTPLVFTIDDRCSPVLVRPGEECADAQRVFDLLMLGASSGNVIEVAAGGEDEERAIAAITSLVMQGFVSGTAN
jgi:phosphotransferase system HPr (HPr) family protein